MLEIIYRDDFLIAVNKPNGLLVHRTSLASDASEFALQTLRGQIGQHVFPAHRLDRKTSGVLLFALDQKTNSIMHRKFAKNQVEKKYLAIVRGYTEEEGVIDYPLKKENGIIQDAITHYQTIARSEIEIPQQRNPTSRYSLVEITPKTGRMHQIRKHFAHIFHPIIGDRPHGCNKQNRLFKEKWNMTTMLLHAAEIKFGHPVYEIEIVIQSGVNEEFKRMAVMMGWGDLAI